MNPTPSSPNEEPLSPDGSWGPFEPLPVSENTFKEEPQLNPDSLSPLEALPPLPEINPIIELAEDSHFEESETTEDTKSSRAPQTLPAKLPPGQILWLRLNQPIYLRHYYRSWMLSVVSLGLIALMAYGMWHINASNPAAIAPPIVADDDQTALRFQGVEMRGRKNGTPFFAIFADKVEVSRDQRYVNFLKDTQKTHGEFYNLKDWESMGEAEGRRRAVKWEAQNAEYDSQLQNLRMRDNVKIVTDTNDIMVTSEMLWNRQDETLTGKYRTKLRTHKDTYMEANQLLVKSREKEMHLQGKVFIEMRVGDDQSVSFEEFN